MRKYLVWRDGVPGDWRELGEKQFEKVLAEPDGRQFLLLPAYEGGDSYVLECTREQLARHLLGGEPSEADAPESAALRAWKSAHAGVLTQWAFGTEEREALERAMAALAPEEAELIDWVYLQRGARADYAARKGLSAAEVAQRERAAVRHMRAALGAKKSKTELKRRRITD